MPKNNPKFLQCAFSVKYSASVYIVLTTNPSVRRQPLYPPPILTVKASAKTATIERHGVQERKTPKGASNTKNAPHGAASAAVAAIQKTGQGKKPKGVFFKNAEK